MADPELMKQIEENNTTLLLVPSVSHGKVLLDLTQELAEKHSVCYITFGKGYASLKEAFGKRNVKMDNIVFIDTISRTIKSGPNQTAGCYFVSSPAALTDVSILIERMISYKFKFFIFDSLTSLRIYQKDVPITKFALHISTKMRHAGLHALFYALNVSDHEGMVHECSMIVDSLIELK